MINILLSVRRPFSDLILSGRKTIEIRKTRPREEMVYNLTLWIYESGKGGARQIIGKAKYFGQGRVTGPGTGGVVDWVAMHAHIDNKELAKYAPCWAWLVGSAEKIKPVKLSAIGMTRPPQSWQYITDEQAGILEGRIS